MAARYLRTNLKGNEKLLYQHFVPRDFKVSSIITSLTDGKIL